ncbi:hypothetical protein RYA99_27020, partial [Pseudomonas syringae pv. actinidifoliorum]|nr:hypothetical protein [Pseudomonas syringae pv. actinidifoliorum]MDU8524021.1 hypothetical protein [Pseudomonas syringae pv. actinidifoliorum]MDU8529806.1 hypothetical protein [Pseudomonas syringae pv. actinidifoliorum]
CVRTPTIRACSHRDQWVTWKREQTLVCVLEDFEIAPEPVHVVYSEGRRGSSKVRSFVDFCVSALREDLQFESAG